MVASLQIFRLTSSKSFLMALKQMGGRQACLSLLRHPLIQHLLQALCLIMTGKAYEHHVTIKMHLRVYRQEYDAAPFTLSFKIELAIPNVQAHSMTDQITRARTPRPGKEVQEDQGAMHVLELCCMVLHYAALSQ